MTKIRKSNKASILIVFSLILFIIAIIMALISTSKLAAKKEKLLEYSEKSYIDYEIKKDNINIMKDIFINFNYSFLTDKKVDFDYEYDISASIIAINKDTGKNLYYRQIVLVPSKKIGQVDTATYLINESLNIDYDEYNKILEESLEKKNLNNIEASLTITLNTNTISESFDEKLQVNSSSVINIPLLNNDEPITKKELNEKSNLIGFKEEIIKNKKLFAISIVMASLSSIILIVAFIYILMNPTIENSYNKEYKKVAKIVRDYDELIERTYKMPSLKDKQIIEVSNINDFIAIRDKYELTFTMVDKNDIVLFIMLYNNKVWQYSIEKK